MVTVIEEIRNLATRDVQRSFIGGKVLNITIDNDDFNDDNSFAIRAKNYNNVLIQLINKGTTNKFDFEIYSTLVDSETVPAFSKIEWAALENGVGDIRTESNDTFLNNTPSEWILVRLKRTIIGQDTTADVRIAGNTD